MSLEVGDVDAATVELSSKAAAEIGWRQFKRGQPREALAILRSALNTDPDNLELTLLCGRVLGGLRSDGAELMLRRAIELVPSSVEAWKALAEVLMAAKRRDEAEEAYRQALSLDPNSLWTLIGLAEVLSKKRRFAEACELMEHACRLAPKDAKILGRFSRMLLDESVRRATLALECSPDSPLPKWVLQRAKTAFGDDLAQPALGTTVDQRTRPAIWPRWQTGFADLEAVIRRSVLPGSLPERPLIGPSSRIATFGSCFAEHLANALSRRGLQVHFQKRQETIDNLFSARRHLEELARDPDSIGSAPFRNVDLFVLSLGVAAAFFDPETGQHVLIGGEEKALVSSRYVFRMMSVAENAAHLRALLDSIKILSPSAAVVLTVSPVPLAATFERPSAVQADAISKSTLRLTAEQIMHEQRPNVHYWPSFEIVRWLGAHVAPHRPPIFGEEDNATRHVSMWAVDMIMGLFLEKFAEGLDAPV